VGGGWGVSLNEKKEKKLQSLAGNSPSAPKTYKKKSTTGAGGGVKQVHTRKSRDTAKLNESPGSKRKHRTSRGKKNESHSSFHNKGERNEGLDKRMKGVPSREAGKKSKHSGPQPVVALGGGGGDSQCERVPSV